MSLTPAKKLLNHMYLIFFLNCVVSCIWSLISEVIAMQRRQRPTKGKESAPAPNLWPGETHTVRIQKNYLPSVHRHFHFITVCLSSSHFTSSLQSCTGCLCLVFSLLQLCIQKPQRDAAVWCLLEQILWMCVCVCV